MITLFVSVVAFILLTATLSWHLDSWDGRANFGRSLCTVVLCFLVLADGGYVGFLLSNVVKIHP